MHVYLFQYRMFTELKKVRIKVPAWLEIEETIFKSHP